MSRVATRLLEALEADRAALLSADYAGLPRSEAALARGLEQLRPGDLDAEDLARLVAAAKRNLCLIEAARDGFRAADPEQRNRARLFTTYGADGGATALGRSDSAHDLRR